MLRTTRMEIQPNTLNLLEVTFSPLSLVDDFGQVFFYKGRIFRGIQKGKSEICLDFLKSDLFNKLERESLLVKTWVSELNHEHYDLILEHELLQESKPHHWSFNMYKDAAMLILRLNETCKEFDYELKDAHPYNVLFKNNRPIFVDFGSILKKTDSSDNWSAYGQFVNYNYLQLLIWSKGDYFTARKLIEDGNSPVARTIPMTSVLDSSITRFFDNTRSNIIKNNAVFLCVKAFNKLSRYLFKKNTINLIYNTKLKPYKKIKKSLSVLQKVDTDSTWKNYHNSYKAEEEILSTTRFDRIIELIKVHAGEIQTSTDLAGNQGVFSQILYKKMKLKKLILTDYDEMAIDIAYTSLKCTEAQIIPFLYNFMLPFREEEAIGLKSDIAFALAITHHLILTQKYALNTIFRRISAHSNKYVAIEFMPLGLWDGNTAPEMPEWYNLEWFKKEFLNYFELIHEENLESNRIFFLGKKNF
jgi:hypothetical protein